MTNDETQERMLAGIEELLSQLDDLSFSQLLRLRNLDPMRVKQVQQELVKVRRALIKAQQVLGRLDLAIPEREERER
ncbi:MAG: hypothetical protein ACYCWN_11660 [Ferrimicrobium sp.]|jgi:hypothetical protein|uniref:50S ribosomal protein L29 n=1 Tax=Ferrimicrobium acidiphilum TaxID=121039 RepID=A0ABV3Y086_9ACTN|nr:hypothetical protein [Ferrimicrobium sp.]MCL5973805.1 hypothetical protein [Actinomycetota bacterium]